jgi:hypothetical protein
MGVALVLATASSVLAQSADEIIAKNIKAQGGKDALLGLKSVERKGTVAVDGSFGQMEGTIEEVTIPWKKARRALDLAVFQQKDGFNGKTAWRDGMNGIQEIDGEEANQIKQSVELNPFINLKEKEATVEKLEDEKVEDTEYYVLKVSIKDRPEVKYYINKESGLLNRMTMTQSNPQFGEVQVVIQNTDYEEFGPVKLPNKNSIQLGEALQIDTTYTETKVNGTVDDGIFELPKADAPAEEPKKEEKK